MHYRGAQPASSCYRAPYLRLPCAALQNILPSDYYTSHLLVSRADQEVLKDLVDRTLPKLAAHLEDQGVELSAITFGWFLSLFTDCLPIQVSAHCFFDMTLYRRG